MKGEVKGGEDGRIDVELMRKGCEGRLKGRRMGEKASWKLMRREGALTVKWSVVVVVWRGCCCGAVRGVQVAC